MEDAYILISERKLASLNELLPLLEKVVQAGKPLLIIADDVEAEIMAALVVNKLRGSLKVAAVKGPAYGELRKEILQDIAVMTGGTVNSDELGFKLYTACLDLLGRARRSSSTSKTPRSPRAPARGQTSRPALPRSRCSSSGPPPITTSRSRRNGWRALPAVSL